MLARKVAAQSSYVPESECFLPRSSKNRISRMPLRLFIDIADSSPLFKFELKVHIYARYSRSLDFIAFLVGEVAEGGYLVPVTPITGFITKN